MLRSLVGSEMCIRDSQRRVRGSLAHPSMSAGGWKCGNAPTLLGKPPVKYSDRLPPPPDHVPRVFHSTSQTENGMQHHLSGSRASDTVQCRRPPESRPWRHLTKQEQQAALANGSKSKADPPKIQAAGGWRIPTHEPQPHARRTAWTGSDPEGDATCHQLKASWQNPAPQSWPEDAETWEVDDEPVLPDAELDFSCPPIPGDAAAGCQSRRVQREQVHQRERNRQILSGDCVRLVLEGDPDVALMIHANEHRLTRELSHVSCGVVVDKDQGGPIYPGDEILIRGLRSGVRGEGGKFLEANRQGQVGTWETCLGREQRWKVHVIDKNEAGAVCGMGAECNSRGCKGSSAWILSHAT
eukprot:TRINITY_DN24468_c0_g1_i1.p1 TRINITY_DN24468_c0_g1~~TRINITY_DN24468_c0_g1_i1.p1  ORF type:complete len:407 (-),score=61.61 TRINITY_DN24468_c0_g1_i1:693-1757(-)